MEIIFYLERECTYEINVNRSFDIMLVNNSDTVHNNIKAPEFQGNFFEWTLYFQTTGHICLTEYYRSFWKFILQMFNALMRVDDIEYS